MPATLGSIAPVIPASTLDGLAEALAVAPNGELRFATALVDVDPLRLVRSGAEFFGRAFYFSTPDGEEYGGLGTAWQATASGSERFEATTAAIGALGLPPPFRAMVGFSFAPGGPRTRAWSSFAAIDAVLPMVSLVPTPDGIVLAIAGPSGVDPQQILAPLRALVEPPEPPYPDLGGHTLESIPSVADWQTAVTEAVDTIRRDALRKVVLSRSVIVRSDTAPNGFDLLHHLEATYPRCFGFGWQAGSATFVGASPELLVRSIGRVVNSNPLAGSAPRGEGEEEDRALAEGLMRSRKDRIEHRLVVDDVVDRLRPFLSNVDVPDSPSLKRMATVQHLSTPVSGTLARPTHVLALADALHPTPAVGGTPRRQSMDFIDKVEGFDRGWYAGGVGWVDGTGDGEFAIALRCGLLEGTQAHVFAGAGIVADSDPNAELLETRLKLRPLLELLAAS